MIVTEATVKAFAHCRHPLCPGYGQEEVDAVRTETAYGFKDNGGDLPGIERSMVMLVFADDDARACRNCGRDRELTGDARPSYQPLSGFDPMGLINGSVAPFDPNVVNTEADQRIAALEAQIAKLAAAVEAKDA